MDWNKVIGSKGRAHFKQRSYTNNQGEEKFTNDIERSHRLQRRVLFPDDLPF